MRVLVVEDNLRFLQVLEEHLRKATYTVDGAQSLQQFSEIVDIDSYDLCLVDLGLPDGDGLALIRWIRTARRHIPILVLSGRARVEDRVTGLDAGADDYLPKPFHIAELLARMRALLRRPARIEGESFTAGALVFNATTNELLCAGRRIDLRPSELRLLGLLIRRCGHVVPKTAIQNALQSLRDDVSPNAIDKLVSRLRRALEGQPAGIHLKTVKGIGYVLEEMRT